MMEPFLKNTFRVLDTFFILGGKSWKYLTNPSIPFPKLLRETFEELGTTYIKLGQFIASSPTFFPEEYVTEFQKCFDETPPVPFSTIESILKEEFPYPLSKIFSSIEKEPLASASIAQVHGAKLYDGTDVVLKIQKPGVKEIIETDMEFLHVASRIFEMILPEMDRLSISEITYDLKQAMIKECDFLLEAKHTKAFRKFLDDYGIDFATAPKIYEEYTTKRVITMERLYGVPLKDIEKWKSLSGDPASVIQKALYVWFLSFLGCDFFHADVHSGNLLYLYDGRIAFIDFGITGRISPRTWQGIRNIIHAMESEPVDYTTMAEGLIQAGITKQNVSKEKLARDLRKAFETFYELENILLLEEINENEINRKLRKFIDVAKENGIRFPREFGLVFKQFLYFEKFLRILAPELHIADSLKLLP